MAGSAAKESGSSSGGGVGGGGGRLWERELGGEGSGAVKACYANGSVQVSTYEDKVQLKRTALTFTRP